MDTYITPISDEAVNGRIIFILRHRNALPINILPLCTQRGKNVRSKRAELSCRWKRRRRHTHFGDHVGNECSRIIQGSGRRGEAVGQGVKVTRVHGDGAARHHHRRTPTPYGPAVTGILWIRPGVRGRGSLGLRGRCLGGRRLRRVGILLPDGVRTVSVHGNRAHDELVPTDEFRDSRTPTLEAAVS